ncbi:MAG: regulatory protein RecX [Deltaproteobacteria bacterium]|nr:regulatory protein RecX [Candidatus Anaeroferrophillacea bacterium]
MATPTFDKALDFLARRPHFEAELRRKLADRDFAAADIEVAIARLCELGYLDDAAWGRRLAHRYLWEKGYGRRLIGHKLRQAGAGAELSRALAAELFADLDGADLEPVFERLAARCRGDLYAALVRRGFLPEEFADFVRRRRQERAHYKSSTMMFP